MSHVSEWTVKLYRYEHDAQTDAHAVHLTAGDADEVIFSGR
jgi:hypothetical protein